jgi:putative FmdB family regulatory protein
MPTYDYHCETCGQDFEYFQSMSSPKLTTCPENLCASATAKGEGLVIRKISGGAGLVFNGDGFYLTDYVHKSGTASKGTSAATKSADKSADAPSTSTDSASSTSKNSVSNSSSDSTSGTSSAS